MKNWLYPANPKIYHIVAAFSHADETPWPMSSKVELDDFVYIYGGQPYKQILFKCRVVDIGLPPEAVIEKAQKYIKVSGKTPDKPFMMLKTVYEFEMNSNSPVSFHMIKQNGLKGSIMGPRCLENNLELLEYIQSMEE